MSEHPSPSSAPASPAGWRAWRILAALLLLAAAGLKAHQLATSPAAVVAATSGFGTGVFAGVPFLTGVVVAEILMAGWLLSMVCPAVTRWLGVVVFTAFAGVALTKALGGAASCGCFGRFTVNPWVTFGLDLTLAAGFVYFRPGGRAGARPFAGRGLSSTCAAASVALATAAAVWIATAEAPATLAGGGDLIGEGAFVVLEPETWLGQPCPLIAHIDTTADLTVGEQTLVLYSYSCGHCIESIPGYEARARAGESVVLVSMPPYAGPGQSPVTPDSPCSTARLSDAREWFVQTPAEIQLRGGEVIFAKEGGFH